MSHESDQYRKQAAQHFRAARKFVKASPQQDVSLTLARGYKSIAVSEEAASGEKRPRRPLSDK